MRKLAIIALLVILVVLAGCAKKPMPEDKAADTTMPSEEPVTDEGSTLDTSVSEADELSEDLSSDDVEEGLSDLDPDEMQDYDF